ncbi:MAG: DUF4236 domain-containing protein [Microbacteriaceae bacterium]
MALSFRRTFRLGKNARVNVSKSGVSVSAKRGRLTTNTRGKGSFRIAKGISFKF